MQQARVIIVNSSGKPVPNSSVFIAPLNAASNFLVKANFYSDNNISVASYKVEELAKNAFHIELGNFVDEQVLVLEFLTLIPTGFVVEFGGQTESKKRVINAGTCDQKGSPSGVSLPVNFFQKSDFPEVHDAELFGKIEDISDPIGPISFEVVLDYDCGSGLERQTVQMGGPVEYCNIKLNIPPDD